LLIWSCVTSCQSPTPISVPINSRTFSMPSTATRNLLDSGAMTIVVAHAGASGHAPANTLGAYRRAHATYDGVWMEFDTQFTSDDELVAVHDDTLDRTTDWSGHVADFTAEDLKRCNAAA